MAERQHNRGPSGGRRPSGRRNGGGTASPRAWTEPSQSGVPAYIEPEVRRWPHPVDDGAPSPAPEPALHYIRCALSYQNQLLADIKALLEQLVSPAETAEENPSKP